MGYKKDMSQYEYLEGWERISLGEWLRNCAERFGESIAVADYESELTYNELDNKVDRLASALFGIGIKAGDKVVIQLPNRISFIVSFFAVIRIGAVPILALSAHREAELEGIMKVAEPKAYIVAERYLGYGYIALAETIREKSPSLQTIIVDGEKGGDFLLSEIDGEKREWDKVDGYSTAVLLLSGGTTGVPKLIPRTHTDYLYNARMSAKRCELKSDAVYLASLPVAHNFPLCCPGLIGTMDMGGTVVLCKNTSPDEILSLITEKQVSITALVPAMVSMCMEMMEWDDSFDLSSLRVLQVGGAMLEDTLADKIIENWSCKLMQVFGTAEGLLCFTKVDDRDEITARCQGTPVSPADEVKIVDEEGNEVQRGEFGELLSRGPYTIDGYYNAEEANAISFTPDGYYKTGDRAMWTAEGNIRMGGRLKEQINRAGEKITPSEVEMYLCQYEDIKEAAVVGVPDEVLGNRNCAFIMTADNKELSRADIYQFLKEKGLAEYKIPDQVECIDSWPLTSVGKIDKKELVVIAESKKQGE